jgi:hypothetical protein
MSQLVPKYRRQFLGLSSQKNDITTRGKVMTEIIIIMIKVAAVIIK